MRRRARVVPAGTKARRDRRWEGDVLLRTYTYRFKVPDVQALTWFWTELDPAFWPQRY